MIAIPTQQIKQNQLKKNELSDKVVKMSEGIPAANRNLPAKDQTIDGNTTICVETANALQSIKEMESKKQTIDAASTSLQYKSASSGK